MKEIKGKEEGMEEGMEVKKEKGGVDKEKRRKITLLIKNFKSHWRMQKALCSESVEMGSGPGPGP